MSRPSVVTVSSFGRQKLIQNMTRVSVYAFKQVIVSFLKEKENSPLFICDVFLLTVLGCTCCWELSEKPTELNLTALTSLLVVFGPGVGAWLSVICVLQSYSDMVVPCYREMELSCMKFGLTSSHEMDLNEHQTMYINNNNNIINNINNNQPASSYYCNTSAPVLIVVLSWQGHCIS